MKIILTTIILLYAGLLLISAILAFKKRKILQFSSFLLILVTLMLIFSVFIGNFYLLGLTFLSISIISWQNAPYLSEKRHLSHHLVRLAFHLTLLVLYFLLP